METNKRVLLAFALSFAILVVWQHFFLPPSPPPSPKTPAAQAPAGQVPAPSKAPAAASAPVPAEPAKRVELAVQEGKAAEEIVVEGEFSRIAVSTQGGVVKSWVLTKYRDEKGQPLDVVNRAACESLGFPMSLNLADAELAKKLNSALYVATPSVASLTAPAKLDLTFSDGAVEVKKRFSFGPGYEVRVEVRVFDGHQNLPVEVAWLGGFGDHSLPQGRAAFAEQTVFQAASTGKIQRESLSPSFLGRWFSSGDQPAEPKVDVPGPLDFAGLEDRYFTGIFLPGSTDQAFRVKRLPWTPPDWKGKDSDRPSPLAAWLGSAGSKPRALRLFVAPRDPEALTAANPPLGSLVDYGWFSFVAKPLFMALHYIYERWPHNYGWAIVLLTIIITIATFPLKLKSIRSAQKMQKIAPLVKSIQDRYKEYKFNDPRKQRMNQEVMKIYSEHGINPLGGCLPMLLQLPFLYGFYRVLDLSIELRHAPWFWWVQDLSAPDPLYILPVVMTVTMFIMQKMTPMMTADPAQARMMMMMPVVFGFMSINFASGLVLYWLTSNVVGIAQQMLLNRFMPPPPPITPPRKVVSAKS